jgi:hypothetical protein
LACINSAQNATSWEIVGLSVVADVLICVVPIHDKKRLTPRQIPAVTIKAAVAHAAQMTARHAAARPRLTLAVDAIPVAIASP